MIRTVTNRERQGAEAHEYRAVEVWDCDAGRARRLLLTAYEEAPLVIRAGRNPEDFILPEDALTDEQAGEWIRDELARAPEDRSAEMRHIVGMGRLLGRGRILPPTEPGDGGGGGDPPPPENLPPIARIIGAWSYPGDGTATLTLSGSTSTDGDGAILGYAWTITLPDDSVLSPTGAAPAPIIGITGPVAVSLTVADDGTPALEHTATATYTPTIPTGETVVQDLSGLTVGATGLPAFFLEGGPMVDNPTAYTWSVLDEATAPSGKKLSLHFRDKNEYVVFWTEPGSAVDSGYFETILPPNVGNFNNHWHVWRGYVVDPAVPLLRGLLIGIEGNSLMAGQIYPAAKSFNRNSANAQFPENFIDWTRPVRLRTDITPQSTGKILRAWAWNDGDPMPAEPQLTWEYTGSDFNDPGYLGLATYSQTRHPLSYLEHGSDRPAYTPDALYSHTVEDFAVTFTDESRVVESTLVAWHWDFGYESSPGIRATSTERNPVHLYTGAGIGKYRPVLTVTAANGKVSTYDRREVVINGNAAQYPKWTGAAPRCGYRSGVYFGEAVVLWRVPADPSTYEETRLYRSEDGGAFALIETYTGVDQYAKEMYRYDDANVQPESTYRYRTTTWNGVQESIADEWYVTMPCDPSYALNEPTNVVRVSSTWLMSDGVTSADEASLNVALQTAPRGTKIIVREGDVQGKINLPAKSGAGWIYVEPENLGSIMATCPEGTRIRPTGIHDGTDPDYPGAPNVDESRFFVIDHAGAERIVQMDGVDTGYLRMTGVVIRNRKERQAAVIEMQGSQSDPDLQPSHVVLDRYLIESRSADGLTRYQLDRGVRGNGRHLHMLGGIIRDIFYPGTECKCFISWYGFGPHNIYNNTWSGGMINVMWGGATHNFAPPLSPNSVSFRRNWLTRPASTFADGQSTKAVFEIKNIESLLVEENLMERNWSGAQVGDMYLIKASGTDSGGIWNETGKRSASAAGIFTTRNWFRDSWLGWRFVAYSQTDPRSQLRRIYSWDNQLDEINNPEKSNEWYKDPQVINENGGNMLSAYTNGQHLEGGGGFHFWNNIQVKRPGQFGRALNLGSAAVEGNRGPGFYYRENIHAAGDSEIKGSGTKVGALGLSETMEPPYIFEDNILVGMENSIADYPESDRPELYPAEVSAVGFTDFAGRDYSLAPESPHKGAGFGGRDRGANNLPILQSAWADVWAGYPEA